MRKKPIVLNVVWSFISLLISTSITMLVLPYVSERIGIDAYGYIALCNNVITYIDLIASTINIYAVRFISIEYHKNNIDKANSYYNSVLIANIIIAIILILPATLCVVFLDNLLNVSQGLLVDVQRLFIFTLLNYIITIIGTVFSVASFIKDCLYKATRYKAEGDVIKGLVLIFLFIGFKPHVWFVSIATIACSLYMVVRNVQLSHRYVPELKVGLKQFSWKAVYEIAASGIWNSIASLGTTLNSGLDLLITNLYLGATKMGQLSVPKTLSNFITIMLVAIVNSFRPQLLVYYTQKKNMHLNNGFLTSMKACGLFTCTIFCVFATIGLSFLNLWIPNENTFLIFQLTLLTFLAEVFTGIVKPLHYGCVLTGKLKVPCLTNLLVGFFNVIGMLFFLKLTNGGLYVVTITTVIGNVIYNFLIMPVYVTHITSLLRKDVYFLILKYIIVTFSITSILLFSFRGINIKNWVTIFAIGIILTILVAFLYVLFMFNKDERGMLLKKIIAKIKM